jgi:hypothetical protein
MNRAQMKGIAMTASDHGMGAQYDATRLTITKTSEGFEVRKGGKLLGVTQTSAGARELAGAL